MGKIKIMVSACLVGEMVRYDGRDNPSEDSILKKWLNEGRIISFVKENRKFYNCKKKWKVRTKIAKLD